MRLLTILITLAAALPAQVTGVVTGFDGKPAARVLLNLQDENGKFVKDVKTNAAGRYGFRRRIAGGSVRAWLEGVELERAIPANGNVDFSFAKCEHFTLRGHAVDPLGKPLIGFEVRCVDADSHYLAKTKTDARGAYSIRMNREVAALVLDPRGWRHQLPGPFRKDRGVALDLRGAGFFRLQGTLRDENGKPVAGAKLRATSKRENVTLATTDADGHWTMWANRPIERLYVNAGEFVRVQTNGDWHEAATIDLDWRKLGLVVVTGLVRDREGKPLANVPLWPNGGRQLNRRLRDPNGRSDGNGRFRMLVPKGTQTLLAIPGRGQRAFADGPFDEDTLDVIVELAKKD